MFSLYLKDTLIGLLGLVGLVVLLGLAALVGLVVPLCLVGSCGYSSS